MCPLRAGFPDNASLSLHTRKKHARPYKCVFHFAGCESTFAYKNDWKRHVNTQHVLLDYWICDEDECGQVSLVSRRSGKSALWLAPLPLTNGVIFNRKDLYIQHVRRMHMPTQLSMAGSLKGPSVGRKRADRQAQALQFLEPYMERPPTRRVVLPSGLLLSGPNATIITGGNHNVRITTITPIICKFLDQVRFNNLRARGRHDNSDTHMVNLRSILGCNPNGSFKPKCSILQFWRTVAAAEGGCTYKPRPLMAVVDDYSEHLCGDRRDNVYALLGLATLPQGRVKVDYGAEVWEVCLGVKEALKGDMANHLPECIADALKLTEEEKGLVRRREWGVVQRGEEEERQVSWGPSGLGGSDAGSSHDDFGTRDSDSGDESWESLD
ncbi:hypothetical protein B0T16DRAFT_461942 [Cercophora newfieldiana]|uniref:C2H2-type domain-containing protein n=1 Tax=Cercophora newfieldiana TaxID=92897 RepID=A0AA39XXJ0_9PEZI|nr:hypothetical protein B0T16DRAFT_461942 [Cercophora newfieldiana]